MAKKKFTTLNHTFMDVEGSEFPEGLIKKLRENELFTYRDMILKEHIYSMDNVTDGLQEQGIRLTKEERSALKELKKLCSKNDSDYFRFVFN